MKAAMKNKPFFPKLFSFIKKRSALLAWALTFLFCFIVILVSQNSSLSVGGDLEDFEVGRVADRDVIAEQSIVYRDEEATRLRIDALERLVPAIFLYSPGDSQLLLDRWNKFASMAASLSGEIYSRDTFRLELQSEFPGDFSDEILDLLFEREDRAEILRDCTLILSTVLGNGIFSMP